MRYRSILSILMCAVLINAIILNYCNGDEAKEDITIVDKIASPDNRLIATIYIASGGGAAGYAYRLIGIRKDKDSFNPNEGIVFQWTGATEVSFRWESNNQVEISYPKSANVYTKTEYFGQVKIKYVEK